jgi:hypothetical protein
VKLGAIVGYVVILACLGANVRALVVPSEARMNDRGPLELRIEHDRIVATKRLPALRRGALFGEDVGLMIRDLEKEILAAKDAGHERVVVSYAGKLSNVLLSTATHVAYPMHVLDQQLPNKTRRQRLVDARDRGATLFIALRPGIGWVSSSVAGALETEDED